MSAPASSATRAILALRVSIEMHMSGSSRLTASTTGIALRSSSSGLTGEAPGRVDSAPISIQSAPSSAILQALAIADSRETTLEAAWNESGVMFRMPIIRGIPPFRRFSIGRQSAIFALPSDACFMM
uniref:Uncharacterized protein n=1 Tax=uncultured marine group II/III euryarchaeote SAT1000_07_H02 TaxID=1456555 RepID=A0A075I2U0_9EURY|nr:hypothetical protein [uncultured marine group II/III euryarchaeote SAT1000_07_H02]